MSDEERPVGVLEWMIAQILVFIPIFNLIFLLKWSFSSATPKSKASWARANLIWFALGAVTTYFILRNFPKILLGIGSAFK